MLLISKGMYLAWGNIWVYFVKWEITEKSPLRSACTTTCACVCTHPHTHARTHTPAIVMTFHLYILLNILKDEIGSLPPLPSYVSLLLPSVSTITDYNQLQSTFLFKTHWQRWKIYLLIFVIYLGVFGNRHKERSGFPGGSDPKEFTCSAGDPGSIPGSGGSPGEGNGNPLQYCHLENPMEGYSPWGREQPVTTERLVLSLTHHREREEIERKREIRKGGKKENSKKKNRLSTGTQ